MSALHVHGKVTPTSRVVRSSRPLKSPLSSSSSPATSSTSRRPPRSSASASDATHSISADQILDIGLPVASPDFRGLDILSAIDYLKLLQSSSPSTSSPPSTSLSPRTPVPPRPLSRPRSRAAREALSATKRHLPPLVLAHQINSLFPSMSSLDRELNHLITTRRIVVVPLPDGDTGYLRREDYPAPSDFLDHILPHLPLDCDDSTVGHAGLDERVVSGYAASGFLVRRNGAWSVSVPNVGLYYRTLRASRIFILTHLRRSRSGIVLEKEVRARYEAWVGVGSGVFRFEGLMHDLVGSGRIEILRVVVGRAYRITKRGREDR